ncbi:Soluble aldose sugar dehydrogenase YliI precursor [Pseudodesulfovibrio hydrargyri]|uniref:Soluble aldose sugar dehydrogenase YliI n=1 Tax=Pseudodesulfovibrio hydrargyri TaxID=2125990 RepID=A0A1J5MVZ3_9BACT|nr:PQQ-dependent sugar dehydrogenase [Pseudodesulfovibrio hydrargyri]OIQ50694.1 Soluble aldose sugar dehydrogenase YliI precursor [Pseudodesulfovibrio hydrargyri]
MSRHILIVPFFLLFLAAAQAGAEPYFSPERTDSVQGVRAVTLLTGLDHPWSMAWLPDGGLLITERPGRMRLFKDGKSTVVPGAPAALVYGQGGLLDIAPHPDFKKNRLVYFTLATGTESANRTALARARFDGERFHDAEVLFAASPAKSGGQHFGSRLAWLPDKTLVLSVGDGGNPPQRVDGMLARDQAQNRASHQGKLIRLKDDGAPAEPPTFADPAAAPGLYTMGHRNIQGMAFDPLRGTLWVSEHAARTGDEINRIEPGRNYGWPKASWSKEYTLPVDVADHHSLPGMVDPVVVWKWRFAPSGLMVYTGDAFPAFRGDLLAGGLRSETIRLIELDESGKVLGDKDLPMGQRVRDVRQGPDGLIYVLTDEDDGRLIRLEPR